MFANSIPQPVPAPGVNAYDIELSPSDHEFQEVSACVPGQKRKECRILKVIRHHIPAALFNGGSGCRVSWSVLTSGNNGSTTHYTVYNRDKTRCPREGVSALTRAGYYLRSARPCSRGM